MDLVKRGRNLKEKNEVHPHRSTRTKARPPLQLTAFALLIGQRVEGDIGGRCSSLPSLLPPSSSTPSSVRNVLNNHVGVRAAARGGDNARKGKSLEPSRRYTRGGAGGGQRTEGQGPERMLMTSGIAKTSCATAVVSIFELNHRSQ